MAVDSYRMKTLATTIVSVILVFGIWKITHNIDNQLVKRKKPTVLFAGNALSSWFHQRSFPGKGIFMANLSRAFEESRSTSQKLSTFPGAWVPIGPANFGGRTLTLAFNPLNPSTILAGSASGGLWRSYTAGLGAQAWHQVATGFPVLGVAAIAFHPNDTNIIMIGTGEVYNDMNTGTGVAVRTTRGTYGIGILKTADGGLSWTKSLDWAYDSLRGVQDIILNPVNPATVFAATTEGTYRSFDGGTTWQLIHGVRMATDLLIMPGDTSVVFIAAGNSFSANPGIYRSQDGGDSFVQISTGLPSGYSGKAMLDVCTSQPGVLYASIGEQITGLGLYKSINAGMSWVQINPTDYQTYQGWYSHDVSVNPTNPDEVVVCGIDVWKSSDGGVTLDQKSYWYNWDFSATTVGGSEGPPDYVHADIHRMFRHPVNEEVIYLATDGGVFRSLDGGETFEGCNGGYQTQQFYANFSCSASDSLFAIGGMQDNATAVYEGNAGWRRVIGGDGVSTAINPLDDQIVFGSSQYLSIRKSTDRAVTFQSASVPGGNGAANTNFVGPLSMSFSNPSVLYAGRDKVYKTTNSAQNWNVTNSNVALDGNAVLAIEISRTNSNLVYAATAPVNIPQVGLFKTTNGGTSWTNVTAGIPNRYIMDLAINPSDNNMVFAALGGFGTPHLYRTLNGGTTWNAVGTGLPDVPANSILIDPLNDNIMYLGNDIGIYVSIDGGNSWVPFSDGLIDGTLVMDISMSLSNRKLRLATHGKGVFERDMLPVTITGVPEPFNNNMINIWPNPASVFIQCNLGSMSEPREITLLDVHGKIIKMIVTDKSLINIQIDDLPEGVYFIQTKLNGRQAVAKFVKI